MQFNSDVRVYTFSVKSVARCRRTITRIKPIIHGNIKAILKSCLEETCGISQREFPWQYDRKFETLELARRTGGRPRRRSRDAIGVKVYERHNDLNSCVIMATRRVWVLLLDAT